MKKKQKNIKKNRQILGAIIIFIGILSVISLFSNKTGIVGRFLKITFFSLLGFGAYIFPIIIIALGLLLIINRANIEEDVKSIYILIMFLSFITLIQIKNPILEGFLNYISEAMEFSLNGSGGGIIGASFAYLFLKLFGPIGSYIILSFIIFISAILFTEISLKDIFRKNKIKIEGKEKRTNKKPVKKQIKKQKKVFIPNENEDFNLDNLDHKENIAIHDYTKKQSIEKPNPKNESKANSNQNSILNYELPKTDILKDIIRNDPNDKKEILNNAKKIEDTMKSFGIEASVLQINRGPTITCYELQPAAGVKVSKIVNLSDDLALNLASSDIRIEAPIPGKSVVGIEVPNKIKDSVGLKELLDSDEFLSLDSKLPLTLGKNIAGNPIISSIDKMPHLLIAGATGSGKSVCINTIIMSILFRAYPHEVKLLLIDPKVVELSIYNGIPHLLIPVVTDPKKAASSLNWAVEEMEKRYKLFAKNNVRDIDSYNNKFSKDMDNKLPKIVIIIDELADLMMVAAQEIEDYICRLAQMARAAGIYLIIATQRPSVDVITGIIKANIPSRISFQVSSQVDSRTILDISGAEKLLGKGDMLFFPSNYSRPIRVQGAFVSDEEVEKVVEYLKNQNLTEYNDEIIESIEENTSVDNLKGDGDELLMDAINLVVEEGQASISLLQRRFRIGYARAARIVDEMEAKGIVGGFEGSKPRKVLINKEELETILRSENI